MTPTFMQTLAWSLLHFLWQGAAIAALAAALIHVFRTPATRYLIGLSALALMLLSFAVTFALLNGASVAAPDLLAAKAPAAAFVSPVETSVPSSKPWTEAQAATDSAIDFAWVARGWLVGVFLLALRIAFGLFVIEQLRRRNLVALPDALVQRFQALEARLGISRGIRYAECGLVSVPAVIGFFRPVVLIPVRALTGLSAEQLEALIAHELGHIKRFDVAVNFVQVVAETLFFFHPAVWWLNKRIRADREDCCDDIAVSAGGSSVGYAKALATIAHWRDVPSFAMAATGGPVAARIARLLGVKRSSGMASVFTASLILAGALIAGAVSLGFVEPAQAQTAAPPAPAAPVNAPSPPAALDVAEPAEPPEPALPVPAPMAAATPVPAARPSAPPQPAPRVGTEPRVGTTPRVGAAPRVSAAPATRPAPAAAPSFNFTDEQESKDESEVVNESYIEEMRAVVGDVSVDDLISLKVQGVTPKYIAHIRSRGLDPSVDQIIAMKVHDVTPDYVKQVRAMGFDVGVDDVINFKVQGITPEYVQQVRGMGFNVGADDMVSMKVQGITPEYAKQMRDLGFKFGADELIGMKVQGVTPEYVKKMRAEGFDMDADEVIAMKVHGVTPEYRKMLESAGFKLDVDELVHAKVMDITPEFIGKAASHGFKNLNLDQLIALKNADVL